MQMLDITVGVGMDYMIFHVHARYFCMCIHMGHLGLQSHPKDLTLHLSYCPEYDTLHLSSCPEYNTLHLSYCPEYDALHLSYCPEHDKLHLSYCPEYDADAWRHRSCRRGHNGRSSRHARLALPPGSILPLTWAKSSGWRSERLPCLCPCQKLWWRRSPGGQGRAQAGLKANTVVFLLTIMMNI